MSITFLVFEVITVFLIGCSFVVWTFIEFEKVCLQEEEEKKDNASNQ